QVCDHVAEAHLGGRGLVAVLVRRHLLRGVHDILRLALRYGPDAVLTGFCACPRATTVRGRVQSASNVIPGVDLILESPVKGVVAAAEFCIGKGPASRLD